jgi:Skp family chaperone for outer membrane proteins
MRHRIALAVAWFLIAIAAPVAAQEPPQGAPAPIVATDTVLVVDFDLIVRQSMAAEDIENQLHDTRTTAQQEFDEVSQELVKAQTDLTNEQSTLPKDQLDEKKRDFERRYTEFQQAVQARLTALNQAEASAMRQVREGLRDIIAEIAQERKAQLVLNRSSDTVVLVDQRLDITQEAQTRLDARLPKVAVIIPKP